VNALKGRKTSKSRRLSEAANAQEAPPITRGGFKRIGSAGSITAIKQRSGLSGAGALASLKVIYELF
jgi:hypothetical protein